MFLLKLLFVSPYTVHYFSLSSIQLSRDEELPKSLISGGQLVVVWTDARQVGFPLVTLVCWCWCWCAPVTLAQP